MRDENAPDTKINVTLLQSHYPQFIGANVHYDIAAALTPAYIQQSIKRRRRESSGVEPLGIKTEERRDDWVVT